MLTSKKFILTKRNVYHILSRKHYCILLQRTLLSFFNIKITLLFLQIFAIILFLLWTLRIRIAIYMPVMAVFHTCATHVIKKHIGGEDKNSDQIPFGY